MSISVYFCFLTCFGCQSTVSQLQLEHLPLCWLIFSVVFVALLFVFFSDQDFSFLSIQINDGAEAEMHEV